MDGIVVLCNVDVNVVPVVNNETVDRILHPEWSRAELFGERLQVLFVSEVNTEPGQTPAVRGCGRSTAIVPHVDTQVMMIVPRRQKQGAREIALRDVETPAPCDKILPQHGDWRPGDGCDRLKRPADMEVHSRQVR